MRTYTKIRIYILYIYMWAFCITGYKKQLNLIEIKH